MMETDVITIAVAIAAAVMVEGVAVTDEKTLLTTKHTKWGRQTFRHKGAI